jgi:hypothetical protein
MKEVVGSKDTEESLNTGRLRDVPFDHLVFSE